MSIDIKKISSAVMITMISAGVAGIPAKANAADKAKMEKCYGVVKKAKNDCQTAKHACAGQATQDRNPTEWMLVLKGNCNKIAGGTLKDTKK